MLKLILLTSDKEMIYKAQLAGIDRIFVDLEYINKIERQKGRNAFITHNTVEDVATLRKFVKPGCLLVRVNPINPNLKDEIDRVIGYGADIIMLPMAFDADDVNKFVDLVGGRAKTCPMIETAQAMTRIDDILSVAGVDEIYIGLNDLSISLGLQFMFETLSGGLVEFIANKCIKKGVPFGFGGMAKIGEGTLPAEYILAEHYRLGSSSVILSRTFRNEVDAEGKKVLDLTKEIEKIRNTEKELMNWNETQFEKNRQIVYETVRSIVSQI